MGVPMSKQFAEHLKRVKKTVEGIETSLQLDIADILYHYMERNNINKMQLAKRLQMKEPQLSRILHGSNSTLKSISRISLALGISIKIQPEYIQPGGADQSEPG